MPLLMFETSIKLFVEECINLPLMSNNLKYFMDSEMIFTDLNVLPADVENNSGFFRRFIIIEFDQIISDEEKNPMLANEIIQNELPGVFNWILDGLNRLLM